ncbi:hypothetical protein ABZS77_14255, partial [Micromonospora sp. NPDC005298]|uniref:hypothetical protein n=1 Tax=Micromonospora sp. NPDC005298 TaxID=3156873 RepID=UPI0033A77DA3
MAKHRASGDDQLTRQGVIETPDAAYWSVDDSRWPAVRPDLPAHVVDLLAPPIVVGVARVPVTSRLTPPADDVSADVPTPVVAPTPPTVPALASVPSDPVPPSAAAPAEPAPPPPAPAPPRPVPTPPLNPRPVPAPPPERPVPGPPVRSTSMTAEQLISFARGAP